MKGKYQIIDNDSNAILENCSALRHTIRVNQCLT